MEQSDAQISPPDNSQPIESKSSMEQDKVITDLEKREEYKNSLLLDHLRTQRELIKKGEWPFGNSYVATFHDVDGTFIPSMRPGGPVHRSDHLAAALEQEHIINIGISGRDRSLFAEGQIGGAKYEEEHIPLFDVEAGAVGTQIDVAQKDGTYAKDAEWEKSLRDSNFRRVEIHQMCESFIANLPQEMQSANVVFQGRDSQSNVDAYIKFPPDEAQRMTGLLAPQEFKVSLLFEGNQQTINTTREQFRKLLDEHGYNKVKIVISLATDKGDGTNTYNIDLLPVTKKDALNYMKKTYGVVGTVAGDSGNDEDMLFNSDAEIAILPYGTKKELVNELASVRKEARRIIKETEHILVYEDAEGKRHTILMQLEKLKGTEEDKGPKSVEYLLRGARRISRYFFDKQGKRVEP